MASYVLFTRRWDHRIALWLACLTCVLIAEGFAITHSYLWAAPLACLLVVAVAIDIPLVPFLGATFIVRILTDASLSSPTIRNTGSLNLSAAIALIFILVAIGLLIRRRHGALPAVLAIVWLGIWTAVAVNSHGASTTTIREGVREASIVALFVIVYNSRGILNLSAVTRVIQIVGTASALVAMYQLATHTGVLLEGHVRANGTFVHPDGAALFFAIAAIASVWRYVDRGRHRLDAIFAAICIAGTIATFSLAGLASLIVMFIVFGVLRSDSTRLKFRTCALAGLVLIAFFATPLGAQRIASESTTQFSTTQKFGEENTSLAWRLYKWGTLIREWEEAPFLGKGLGTTVTVESTGRNYTAGKEPHNEYLRYLVETGIVGLLILLGAIMLLVRRLSERRRSSSAGSGVYGPGAAVLGLAVVAGCLLNALPDNTFLYTTTGYAAALILGAVLSPIPTVALSGKALQENA